MKIAPWLFFAFMVTVFVAGRATADPNFNHGLCVAGAGGGSMAVTGNQVVSCLRYDPVPSSFPCQYGWQVNYDPSRATPTDVYRTDLRGGTFGPGSDIVWFTPSPGELTAFIVDTDGIGGNSPLTDPAFFPPGGLSHLTVQWDISALPLGLSTTFDGQGGVELIYTGGSACSITGIVDNTMADVTVTRVPEAMHTAQLAALIVTGFAWRRKVRS